MATIPYDPSMGFASVEESIGVLLTDLDAMKANGAINDEAYKYMKDKLLAMAEKCYENKETCRNEYGYSRGSYSF